MARKGESIFKRRDGRWEARYVKLRDESGKILKYGYIYGKSYSEVKKKRELAIKNLKLADDYKKENSCGFSCSIRKWLQERLNIKESTRYNYSCIIERRLIPFFFNAKLNSITDKNICEFIQSLKNENLSSKRIKDILTLLNEFLSYNGIKLKCAYTSQIKKKIKTFSVEEINKIERDVLKNNDIKKFAVLFTLFTGIRIGELCALKWEDIDLNAKVIHITKNVIRIKSNKGNTKTLTKLDTPKTITSIRDVPINNNLIKNLQALKGSDNEYILTGTDEYMPPNVYYYFYKNYMKSLGILEHNFHSIRHTFATRSLEFGMDIKTLSVLLGHASIKITLDLYVHITEEEKRKQINKIPLLTLKK